MKIRILLILLITSCCIGSVSANTLCKQSEILLPPSAEFKIDVAKVVDTLHPFWQSTGFSPSNLLLNKDMQQAVAYWGSIPNNGIKYVRIHYLIEQVHIKDFAKASVEYDWSALDECLDVLNRNDLCLFFELMGFPSGIEIDFEKHEHIVGWKHLVTALANHYAERYGKDRIRSWYFETWNEPDISFWKQSDKAFMNYYDACSEGLKAADEKLVFGGPGTARTLSDRFKNLLAHCDTGTNYLTGEKGVRLDFISVHEKGVKSHDEDISPNTISIIERESKAVEYIQKNHPKFKDLPFINNECDPQVGWSRFHTWRGLPYYSAIAAKIVHQHISALSDALGVNYGLLSNDNGFLGPWGNRSLMARFGVLKDVDIGQAAERKGLIRFQEDTRRRSFEHIKKPIFNVMVMLSMLGNKRLQVESNFDWQNEVGVIATDYNNEQIALLVFNSRDNMYLSGVKHIKLYLQNLPFNECNLVHYRIDETHSNPFRIWENQGAPNIPNDEQLALIQKNMELEMIESPWMGSIQDNTLDICFDLPLHGVSLILINKSTYKIPGKVTGLHYERYEGTGDTPRVLLLWDQVASRYVKSYDVLYSKDENGTFEKVNPADNLTTAFSHNAPPGKGFYKVQAVDFWSRKSKPSDLMIVE